MIKSKTLLAAALLPFILHSPPVRAETPPESGELFEFTADMDISGLKAEKAEVVVSEDSGTPTIKLIYLESKGYPGVDFPPPAGQWDLSAFSGVEVEVTNPNSYKVGVGLRVDNPGDWRQSPWSSEVAWLDPGESGAVRVTFGQSHGQPAYELDPSLISNIKVLVSNPPGEGEILIHGLKAVGTGSD